MEVNDYISFKVSGTSDILVARVLGVAHFKTFAAALTANGIERMLPAKVDLVDAVELYHSFANRSGRSYKILEQECGVVALTLLPLGQ